MLCCHGQLSWIYRKKKCIAYLPPQSPIPREDVRSVSTSTDMHPIIHLEEGRGSGSTLGYWRLRFIVLIAQSVGMGWWVAGGKHITHDRKRLIRDRQLLTCHSIKRILCVSCSQQSVQVPLRRWLPHILSGVLKSLWSSSVGVRGET